MSIFRDIANLISNTGGKKSEKIFVYKIYKHGKLTWLVDTTATSASFLHLYSANTTKAKIFKLIMKLIWAFKVPGFFFKKEEISYSKRSFIGELFSKPISEFSLFTGTVGENRKLVVYFRYMGKGQFVKFPFGSESQPLVEKEHKSLVYLNELNLSSILVPSITHKKTFTMISDVCDQKSVTYDVLDSRAFSFCEELISKTLTLKSFISLDNDFGISSEIQSIIHDLKFTSDVRLKNIMTSLINSTLKLVENLDDDFKVSSTYSHGDFTPWNSFSTRSQLALIDWELSGNYPVFFDLIHFTVSKNALLGELKLDLIGSELLVIKKTLIERGSLIIKDEHFHIYIRLYSVISIALYGKKFLMQDNQLHEQAYVLLKVWESLLSYE